MPSGIFFLVFADEDTQFTCARTHMFTPARFVSLFCSIFVRLGYLFCCVFVWFLLLISFILYLRIAECRQRCVLSATKVLYTVCTTDYASQGMFVYVLFTMYKQLKLCACYYQSLLKKKTTKK